MAYQSQHTGNEIDTGISINSTQNTKIANLETDVSKLNTSIYNSGSTNQHLTKSGTNTVAWKTLVIPSVLIFSE